MTEENVRGVLNRLSGRTFTHLYYVACGGSSALMLPSKYFADTKARRLPSDCFNSAEFIARDPAALSEKSVVLLCSQEGKTPETVEAARFARQKGATVIAVAMVKDSPLEKEAEFFVQYGHYETSDAIDTSYGVMYMLTAGILQQQEGTPLLEDMVKNLKALTPVIEATKKQFEPHAETFAEECKDAGVLYALASGSNYSQAYVFCNCYMMEMQWINAIPIHAGEFFHGPFEIIEKDSPVLILLGRDSTRPLEERALRFCKKHTDRLYVINMEEVNFEGIDKAFEGVMTPLVLNNVCRLFSKTLAKVRGHSLDIRRYMHLVEY